MREGKMSKIFNAGRLWRTALAIAVAVAVVAVAGCASKPKVKIVEMENKGTAIGVSTPDWVKNYVANGISSVQKQSEFKDKYCIIGEEAGVNKQFVLAWADSFSAQQRIGAMLRTNIESKYQAKVSGQARSSGGANSSTAAGTSSGDYGQEIDNSINVVVNVAYSGAQRENDWWMLNRRYDPDQKDVYTDEYTAYVLYTIPKAELNRQVASALETSVSKDSQLYEITIAMAREILLEGFEYLGDGAAPSAQNATPAQAGGVSNAPQTAGSQRTYHLSPRVRVWQGGVNKNLWADRIVVRDDYFTVFFTGSVVGKGGDGDSSAFWYTRVILTDLDNPSRVWESISTGEDDDASIADSTNGIYRTFQGVTAKRFSITGTGNPPYTFEEIVMPDKPDA